MELSHPVTITEEYVHRRDQRTHTHTHALESPTRREGSNGQRCSSLHEFYCIRVGLADHEVSPPLREYTPQS
ncbi:hypothetical protein WN55_05271 [Dufourea novaeangliae]|uniref:Uncharacterized protein n=1 Tax=Dufourea novaeangliae TaxID=178035 RepID=A0A154NXR8_DUFNO|nr:hypothetical protein WN55_05271 [Dufourea novaeangliae]